MIRKKQTNMGDSAKGIAQSKEGKENRFTSSLNGVKKSRLKKGTDRRKAADGRSWKSSTCAENVRRSEKEIR